MNKEFLTQYGYANATNDICLEYSGHISQIMIKEMLLSLKIETDSMGISLTLLNKLNTSFIEITQNILKYSKKMTDNHKNCLNKVLVFKENEKCYLVSSNIIGASSKEKITSRIDEIQTYNKDQINERYFELCKSGDNSHVQGGGVGLYQIARKSDDIKYMIEKVSDTMYRLKIMVIINIK